jgi:hypothetical protein
MPSELNEKISYITPNITPDPETGWISNWTEAQFIARFHKGRVYEDSPMPWTSFSNFSDNDLKALYRYLRTLEPVKHEVREVVVENR